MADKPRIEKIESWKTTDGKCFSGFYDAKNHQSAIDARQQILSEIKGAVLSDVSVADASGDIQLVVVK